MNVYEKLLDVQSKLKVSKENFNAFGKYKYRSCEDILEGVKPLLKSVGAIVTLADNVELIGDRFYIKAEATFTDIESGEKIPVSAYAREDLDKKGMDLAQVTGSVSSYARKYALNGLFCIDDTKDSDATNEHDKSDKPKVETKPEPKISSVEAGALLKLVKSMHDSHKIDKSADDILKGYKVSAFTELTVKQATQLKQYLKKFDVA